MAKKNFRGGMGNLLEESLHGLNLEDAVVPANTESEIPSLADYEELKAQNEILKRELKLWRQGLLDKDKFEQSLQANQLKYNKKTNSIDPIE